MQGEKHPFWGKHRSEETKEKISRSLRGRTIPEEVRIKISMAQKGKKISEEHKKKLSIFHKGKKLSEETRQKISYAKRHLSEETRRKMSEAHIGQASWNKGLSGYKTKPCSEERKRKISLANLGRKKKEFSIETRRRMSDARKGEKSHFWRGGLTEQTLRIRHGLEYKLWREAIFARDNWTCIWCGRRSRKDEHIELNADHIKPFSLYPELRFDITNGRTLCVDCHKKTETYLYKLNNVERGGDINVGSPQFC